MTLLTTILLVAAFVLLFLAGIGVPDSPRFRLGWMGLACVVLVYLVTHWPK